MSQSNLLAEPLANEKAVTRMLASKGTAEALAVK